VNRKLKVSRKVTAAAAAHVYLDGTHIGWLLAQDGLSKPWLSETVKPVWCD